MRIPLFLLLTLAALGLYAQKENGPQKIDSLRARLRKDSAHIYRFQKLRPYLSLDNRNSWINHQPVNFKGLQAGVILHEKHTLALGLYAMSQKSKRSIRTKDGQQTVERSLSLNYLTLFYQYAVVDKRYFEFDLPFEIGLGGYDIQFRDTVTGHIYREVKGGIIPLGLGVQPVFKPFKWVGIPLLLGYRFVGSNSVANFNGWYYSIGVSLDLRQIVRDSRYYFKKRRFKREVKKL